MSALLEYAVAPDDYVDAIHAASADLDARCKRLLDAREALAWHGDELCAEPECDTGSVGTALDHIVRARRAIEEAVGDLRCKVAIEWNLWDGVDPADVPLDRLELLIRAHRDAARRAFR